MGRNGTETGIFPAQQIGSNGQTTIYPIAPDISSCLRANTFTS